MPAQLDSAAETLYFATNDDGRYSFGFVFSPPRILRVFFLSASYTSLSPAWVSSAAGVRGVEKAVRVRPHWNGWSNLEPAGWPRMLAWQLE